MSEASPPPTPDKPRLTVVIRAARMGDIRPMTKLYLAQTPAERHGYHPFSFNRGRAFLSYFTLVTSMTALGWAMRRSPRLLAQLYVAEVTETHALAGGATLRGVVRPGEEPVLRFGFFVAAPYQGMGVGRKLLWGLAEAGLALGYHRATGAVFTSATHVHPAVAAAGFRLTPTTHVDPRAPEETNFRADSDLDEMVRLSRQRDAGKS